MGTNTGIYDGRAGGSGLRILLIGPLNRECPTIGGLGASGCLPGLNEEKTTSIAV